jgi:NADPH:quinone reductase-like Zn-dependent oxidoreductase
LKSGETVVILGTGGVALFALQLAKSMAAGVVLLSSRDEKLERAAEMGADELVKYKETPNWEGRVLEMTAHVVADLVLELGGAGTLPRSMASVRINGSIRRIAILTGIDGVINPMQIQRKCLSVNGIYVGSRHMQ